MNKAMNQYLRRMLVLSAIAWSVSGWAWAQKADKKMEAAKEAALATINIDAAKAHIGFLASNPLRGRKAGSNDARVAAQYIKSMLIQWGIAPLGDEYEQPFSAYSLEWQK